MVARTRGRFPEPSPSTTSGGTSMPVAVFPSSRTTPWNFIACPFPGWSLSEY